MHVMVHPIQTHSVYSQKYSVCFSKSLWSAVRPGKNTNVILCLSIIFYKIMDAATGCLITVFGHFPSPFRKPFPNDLSFPDIINIFYFIYHSSSSSFCTLLLYILEDIINANKHKISTCTNIIIPVAIEPISLW